MTILGLTGTSLLVFLIGVTLLVGFGADWLARRFRVPDVLWLIGLGIAAGPVFHLVLPASFLPIAPLLGAATLALILFDAGIDLKVRLVRPFAGSALLFALATYIGSSFVLFVVGDLVLFPHETTLALLFGTALGCTSGAVIIPLANRFGLATGLRSFLHLDSAVEDALAVVSVTTVLALLSPSSPSLALNLTSSLILPLPVGIVFGFAAGLLWLLFLYGWQDRPFTALATLGFLFVVYAGAEVAGGSGILAALVFGVVLGNERFVRRFLRRTRPFEISRDLRKVEVEIAFVLRSFFLFLIGVIASLANPGLVPGVAIVVLIVVLLGLRRAVFPAVTRPSKVPRAWANAVAAFSGRGLTSAVLLFVALETVPEVTRVLFPAVLLIVGTNLAMTIWLFVEPPQREPRRFEAEHRWAEAATEFIALTEEEGPLANESAFEEGPSSVPAPSAPPGGRLPPPLPKGPIDRDR